MRRSKLERHIDILRVLAHKGPLKLTHIMYKANLNYRELKKYLDFLLKQAYVEKRTICKAQVIFTISQRGINLLNYFGESTMELPIVEEPQKQVISLIDSQLTYNSNSQRIGYLGN